MKEKGLLVLLRHGESEWNAKNQFTGWVDVPLSQKGIEEALTAGKELSSISFDYVYVSKLTRSQMTALLALSQREDREKTPIFIHEEDTRYQFQEGKVVPITVSDTLNERHYGALQGLNKEAMRHKYGEEKVHLWRRSFDVDPPEGESLKKTSERTLPYFKKEIAPLVQEGRRVLVAAHGNSLRSIVMSLDGLSEAEVTSLEIPTGKPLYYTYREEPYDKERSGGAKGGTWQKR